MATRSRIAMKVNGGYRSIYCHWDGYPEYNGKILFQHYRCEDKIKQLLDLGSMSSLGPNIGEKHDFDARVDDVCTFYGRDRGETEYVDSVFDHNLNDLSDTADNCNAEYVYLWKNGQWYFSPAFPKGLRFIKLSYRVILNITNCPIDEPLIAADWLEEHDRKEEADKIRELLSQPPMCC